MTPSRRRLDADLVRRGLARSRDEAKALIQEGKVTVRGIPTPKPTSLVASDTPIAIASNEHRWVSRGAWKLLAALEEWPITVSGRRAIDVGASTGGFTEVLIAEGAESVLALDVGRAQLHERLLADDRVHSLEQTNFRHVAADIVGAPFDLLVADLSFISLCTVADKMRDVTTSDADIVVLVKPQFEASKREVGSGGVIRDPEVRARAVQKVLTCMAAAGLSAQALIESPVKGGDGNVEYLLWLRKDRAMADVEVPS